MSLFVGWMLLSRLAGMGFSHEGKNYWMLKVSPVRVWQLLASKFLVAYLPALALGFLFLTVISVMQGLSIGEFLYSFIAIVMCLAGMTGMLLSFGVAGANFNWDDPRKMNSGMMGCFGQIVTMHLSADQLRTVHCAIGICPIPGISPDLWLSDLD